MTHATSRRAPGPGGLGLGPGRCVGLNEIIRDVFESHIRAPLLQTESHNACTPPSHIRLNRAQAGVQRTLSQTKLHRFDTLGLHMEYYEPDYHVQASS